MKKTRQKGDKKYQPESPIALSQDNWMSMFNAFDQPAMLLDHEHRILFANTATFNATDMSMDDTVGKKCHEIFHGTEKPPQNCPMQKLLAKNDGEKSRAEVEALGKHFQVDCSPVLLNGDKHPKILHIAMDITERTEYQSKIQQFNNLTSSLLKDDQLEIKLQKTTDLLVEIMGLSFARIWILRKGDKCDTDCLHGNNDFYDNCKTKANCLHMVASSGKYRRLNGTKSRVPLDHYKIGRLATSSDDKIITNNIQNDTLIEDHQWVQHLNLNSFAGFRLKSKDTSTLGVLACFSDKSFSQSDVLLLESLSHNIAQVLHTNKSDIRSQKNWNKYKELFHHAPVGYHQLNKNGIIINVNDTELSMLGYTREEMVGKPVWEFAVNMESKQRVLNKLSGKISKIIPIETFYVNKNKAHIPVLINDRILYDHRGEIKGMFSTIQNIAYRNKIEQELKESVNKFHIIAEKASDAMVIINVDGIITFWNKAATQIFGYEMVEIIGKPVETLMPHSYRKQHPSYIKRIKLGGKPTVAGKTVELVGLRKNGNEFPIELSISVTKVNDKLFISSIIRDISTRKHLEKQLQQSQKMEAVGTLAGGIAHDFNNILGAIIGYTELALDEVDCNTVTHSNLKKLLTSAHRAKDLVKQILTYSRMDELETEQINIHDVVKQTINLIRSSIPTSIKVVKFLRIKNKYILADSSQIHQILLNLCTNAAHAIGDRHGTIIVSLDKYYMDEPTNGHPSTLQGECVKLSVEDTGCGINQSIIDKIFDPFFTTKDVGEGTGLGLSVIKGLIDKMGGYISVQSSEGKGTIFTILLPESTDHSDNEIKEIEYELEGYEKILYVDDEQDLVDIARTKFESMGYSFVGATNSSKALELFNKSPNEYDLVITDQAMPNLTGKELISAILKIRPTTPIILCTGFTNIIDEKSAIKLGVKKFLEKPVKINDLVQAARDVLDNVKKIIPETAYQC